MIEESEFCTECGREYFSFLDSSCPYCGGAEERSVHVQKKRFKNDKEFSRKKKSKINKFKHKY